MNYTNYGRGFTTLTLNFSNTKPNEPVSLSGTWIDFDGKIYGSPSSTIIIRGGDDKGIYAVSGLEEGNFYMTQSQRVSLMQILKGLASTSDIATISSDNGQLLEMSIAIYQNYCG